MAKPNACFLKDNFKYKIDIGSVEIKRKLSFK